MDTPLKVFQDDSGRLRDLNGQPMIIVYNSKTNHFTRPRPAIKSSSQSIHPSFAFVNTTTTKDENVNVRKLIRTHVMRDARRKQRTKRTASNTISQGSSHEPAYAHDSSSGKSSSPIIPLWRLPNDHAFVTYPVVMQPYMYRLIHECKLLFLVI